MFANVGKDLLFLFNIRIIGLHSVRDQDGFSVVRLGDTRLAHHVPLIHLCFSYFISFYLRTLRASVDQRGKKYMRFTAVLMQLRNGRSYVKRDTFVIIITIS